MSLLGSTFIFNAGQSRSTRLVPIVKNKSANILLQRKKNFLFHLKSEIMVEKKCEFRFLISHSLFEMVQKNLQDNNNIILNAKPINHLLRYFVNESP